jgi:hypothetical protein
MKCTIARAKLQTQVRTALSSFQVRSTECAMPKPYRDHAALISILALLPLYLGPVRIPREGVGPYRVLLPRPRRHHVPAPHPPR